MALNTSDILGTETLPWSGTSLSTNCTVPANCGAILAFLKRYTSGSVASISALTIGGNSATDTVAGTSTDEACAFARIYPGLSSGTQAVSGTASSTSAQDTTDLVLVYLSTDVSSVGFRAKNALASGPLLETAKTFTLSGLSVGDLVFQFDSGNQAGSNVPPGLPAGWTSVLTYANDTQPSYFRLSTIVATGSTQSCASQPEINWSALAGVAVYEVAASGATITNVSDTTLANGQTGNIITCTNAEASQGAGVVKICPTDDPNDANGVVQTISGSGWSDTSIEFTAVLGSLPADGSTLYLHIIPDSNDPTTTGAEVLFYNTPQILSETIASILDSATGTRVAWVAPERRVYVNTATGSGSPSDPTNPGDAYDSLETAIAAEADDLPAAQNKLVIECAGGEDAFSTSVTISAAGGWVTSAEYPLEIIVADGSRNGGSQNTGYRITGSRDYAPILTLAVPYANVYYLSVQNGGIASNNTRALDIASGAALVNLTGCLLVAPARPLTCSAGGTYTATNCIFIANGAGLSGVGAAYTTAGNWTFNHCGAVTYSDLHGFYDNGVSTITCRNCWARCPGSGNAYTNVGTLVQCAANDNSGTPALNNMLYSTSTFVSVTQGAEDFHLVAGSVLIDAGSQIGVTEDLEGNSRVGVTPDIGPFEVTSAFVPEAIDHTVVRVYRTITIAN